MNQPAKVPWQWGEPIGGDMYRVGCPDWWETWSPERIHPQAAEWLELAKTTGPSPAKAPDKPDLWFYTFNVQNIS